MKRIQYNKYGGPELMRLDDFELAMPCKGQVAVKVRMRPRLLWSAPTGTHRRT